MKKITREALERMIISALAKIEGCQGVKSVGIQRLRAVPNWDVSTINYGGYDGAEQDTCANVLPEVVQRFQAEYELTP